MLTHPSALPVDLADKRTIDSEVTITLAHQTVANVQQKMLRD